MAVSQDRTLRNSIVRLLVIFYLVESAGFLAVAWIYNFSPNLIIFFLGMETLFLIIVGIFLLLSRQLFYFTKTGNALLTINLACGITLFRITMIPSVFSLIIALKTHHVGLVLAFFIGMACFSDTIDGYISRRRNEETQIGKILDSVSDYLLLGLIAIAYTIYHLLQGWFFWLLISRLLLNSLGMLILYFLRKKLIPETSIFGKIAIAAVMILFVFKPAAIFFAVLKPAAVIIETCVGFIVALSILDKAVFLFTGIMRNLAERK